MHSTLAEAPLLNEADVRRTLLVVWQDPADRRFQTVAQLDQLDDGRFLFKYLDGANAERFFPLDEFPELDRTYVSSTLPVFFANRVMSSERPSYGEYLTWLGLDGTPTADIPVEVLARTGGGRATDTFHLVDSPTRGERHFESRFFVSGLRYAPHGIERAAALNSGDRLSLVPEPNNPKNARAVIVSASDKQQIGWVPDWLCEEVSRLSEEGWDIEAVAERVNPDAPAHTRVLCALVARLDR